jgi:hypothetical protein
MRTNNYIIKYKALDRDGCVLKEGKMLVKRRESSIAAQVDLEKYLNRKLSGFKRLVVIGCEVDNPMRSFFDGVFS